MPAETQRQLSARILLVSRLDAEAFGWLKQSPGSGSDRIFIKVGEEVSEHPRISDIVKDTQALPDDLVLNHAVELPCDDHSLGNR